MFEIEDGSFSVPTYLLFHSIFVLNFYGNLSNFCSIRLEMSRAEFEDGLRSLSHPCPHPPPISFHICVKFLREFLKFLLNQVRDVLVQRSRG